AEVLAKLQQVADCRVEVLGFEGAVVEIGRILVLKKLDVELQPAYARKVILARVEEHSVEESRRGVKRRRISGTEFAVDFDQGFLRSLHRITLQRLADDCSNVVALGEEHAQLDNSSGIENLRNLVGGEFGVGFEQDFSGRCVDNVSGNPCTFKIRDI